MSDETFRFVVAGGVIVAALSFLVMGIVAIFLLQLGLKIKAALDPILDKLNPIMRTVKETAADLQPKIAAISTQAVDVSKLVTTEAHRYSIVAKGFTEKAVDISGLVQTEAHRYSDVSKGFAEKAVDISELVKTEAHRYAEISKDVADRTKVHIEKADEAIDNAVEQVHSAAGTARSAVLRPFREIDGVLTGVSTAISTFARGRRSSVSRANLLKWIVF